MYEERSRGTLEAKRCHLIQIKPIFLTQAGFRQDRMLAKQTPSNYRIILLYYVIILLDYYIIISLYFDIIILLYNYITIL